MSKTADQIRIALAKNQQAAIDIARREGEETERAKWEKEIKNGPLSFPYKLGAKLSNDEWEQKVTAFRDMYKKKSTLPNQNTKDLIRLIELHLLPPKGK